MRKVITVLLAITYLFGCGVIPPLMNVWNREGYIGPFPCFFAGIWVIGALLVGLTWFLFWWERNDNTFD